MNTKLQPVTLQYKALLKAKRFFRDLPPMPAMEIDDSLDFVCESRAFDWLRGVEKNGKRFKVLSYTIIPKKNKS